MSVEGVGAGAAGRIPQLDGGVVPAGGEAAPIWRPGKRMQRAASKGVGAAALGRIP